MPNLICYKHKERKNKVPRYMLILLVIQMADTDTDTDNDTVLFNKIIDIVHILGIGMTPLG
jgi:hypothetical protein